MKFTVFDVETGESIRQGEGTPSAFRAQQRQGRIVREGHFAGTHYYDKDTDELVELDDPTAELQTARALLEVGVNSAGTLTMVDLPDCTISINGTYYEIDDGVAVIERPPPGHYLVQITRPRMKMVSTILEVTE